MKKQNALTGAAGSIEKTTIFFSIAFMDFNKDLLNSRYFELAICILIIIAWMYSRSLQKKELNWSFKGPVEKARYDVKGIPSVTVKGKEYDLYNTLWDFNIKIHKGDTIIKNKRSRRIKVIFRNMKDTTSLMMLNTYIQTAKPL